MIDTMLLSLSLPDAALLQGCLSFCLDLLCDLLTETAILEQSVLGNLVVQNLI